MPKQQRATIILTAENRQREQSLCVGKTAVEVMHKQQARRFELLKKQMGIFDKPAWQLMLDDFQNRVARFTRQQFFYLPDSFVPKSAFKASKALKQSAELLADLVKLSSKKHESDLNDDAQNRVLFSHYSRDNTSQIDSTAQLV